MVSLYAYDNQKQPSDFSKTPDDTKLPIQPEKKSMINLGTVSFSKHQGFEKHISEKKSFFCTSV